jgi:hypothetical protein
MPRSIAALPEDFLPRVDCSAAGRTFARISGFHLFFCNILSPIFVSTSWVDLQGGKMPQQFFSSQ